MEKAESVDPQQSAESSLNTGTEGGARPAAVIQGWIKPSSGGLSLARCVSMEVSGVSAVV
ncbi:unnamed protein product [Arctogadus glacialis]